MLNRRTFIRTLTATAVAGTGAVTLAAPAMAAEHALTVDWMAQTTAFWCGPTAAHMAISAKVNPAPSPQTLAGQLGTNESGTSFGAMAAVLTKNIPGSTYREQWLAGNDATAAEKTEFFDRVKKNIDSGFATVCNWIVPPGHYPNGYQNSGTIYHFVAVTGYDDDRRVRISDSANFDGKGTYWVASDAVATLSAGRGYFW